MREALNSCLKPAIYPLSISLSLVNLRYSTLVAQKSPFSLFSQRVNLSGHTLSNRALQGLLLAGNMVSLHELWVCGPMWMMLSTHHTWLGGGRSRSQHTLLSDFQSSACSNVSKVIRFLTCHREPCLPLSYLDYRYKHKHSRGASTFWPKLELIWLSSPVRSCFLNYGSFPASPLK